MQNPVHVPFTTKDCPCSVSQEMLSWQCQTYAIIISWLSSVPGVQWLCADGVGCTEGSQPQSHGKAWD